LAKTIHVAVIENKSMIQSSDEKNQISIYDNHEKNFEIDDESSGDISIKYTNNQEQYVKCNAF
jgi:hypothetical protein